MTPSTMTKPPIVDAEVLREFFEKAEIYLTEAYLLSLTHGLKTRTESASELSSHWASLWELAPAGRRVPDSVRVIWEPKLQPLIPLLRRGEAYPVVEQLSELGEAPPWLMDWATFWCHVNRPEATWWARWIYGIKSRTGSLALMVDDPGTLAISEASAPVYHVVDQAFQFLKALLDSTHRLAEIDEPYRPIVAAAVVYAVYMFTMASWKMTEEFTKVLPPFPMVVKTLLGLNRWEGK